jgi:hypothetical protein
MQGKNLFDNHYTNNYVQRVKILSRALAREVFDEMSLRERRGNYPEMSSP